MWTPTQLGNNVKAWWDASVLSTITQSSGLVSSWASKVGSITADQSILSNKPTYIATARNSLPGIIFDGIDDNLTMSSISELPLGTTSGVLFIVGYNNHKDSYRSIQMAYGSAFYGAGNLKDSRVIYCDESDIVFISSWGSELSSTSSWSSQDRIIVCEFIGGTSGAVTIDGNASISGSLDYNTGSNTGGYIGDGEFIPGTGRLPSSCTIQECGIISGTLSTADRQRLEGYLAWKWKLRWRLPTTHPYYSRPPGNRSARLLGGL